MTTFTVIKHGKNRFEVVGRICRDLNRYALEDYSRVFTTKKAADADAAKWQRIEVRNAAEHAEIMITRRQIVADYLVARAGRPSAAQISFGF